MKKILLITLIFVCGVITFAEDPELVSNDYQRTLERVWLQSLLKSSDSNWMLPEQDAYGAVDGNRQGKSGFHTDIENSPWWQVELAQIISIDRVVICNSGKQKTKLFRVLLSDDAEKWNVVYKHNGTAFGGSDKDSEPQVVNLKGKQGRYVRICGNKGFLTLNEVEVYAVGDKGKNIALKQPATQSSISKQSTKSMEGRPSWLKTDNPDDIFLKQIATAEYIESALDLADRTLEYVELEFELPQQTKLLKKLHVSWDAKEISPDNYNEFYFKVRHLRREIIFAHPKLSFEKIMINQTPPTMYSHNGDQHLGRHSRIGPGLTLLTDWKISPKTDVFLADKLPKGSVRNPDLHFDAEKVTFAFCDHTLPGERRFFLYEAALDGSWVRQLTGTKRDTFKTWGDRATAFIEDNDPAYLPDGEIVFISTRSQSFGRCHGGRYNPAWVLHRCDANGDSIKQISFNNENEYEPTVLNDGRLAFTRWEYTNRHEMLFHMLWSCRPDGTDVSNFYGADTIFPMMVVEASAIPGTHRITATAMGHHSYNTGTTIVIDKNLGENGEEPITHITPETPYSESGGWPEPHYSHPYAINEEMFLVSRANHPVHPQGHRPPPNDRAIYLIDTLGGREFIYENPETASFSPIAVRKRERPPVLPSMIPENAPNFGTLFVQNAYLTRNDPEGLIKPGMISAIRVNELGVQPMANRHQTSVTIAVEIPKKVLGTVPVDEDGSAFFRVPAGVSLQMQILDKNGMAILTEKSFFYLQPGESRSCIGCHEPTGMTPDMKVLAKNARRQPVDLTPPAGPKYPGGMSFHRTVQPVLDRYCIKCHGLEKTEGKVSLIGEATSFPHSLKELVKRGDHMVGEKGYMGGNDRNANAISNQRNISRPMRFYAHRNKVAKMLLENHGKTNMDHESFMRIIEWLDLNSQATGDLFPNKIEERTINKGNMQKLHEYIRQQFGDEIADQPDHALINPAMPQESRVLMLSLSVEAGGWNVAGGFKSKEDTNFKKLAKMIDDCIVRKKNENQNGWWPTLECGGGENKFIKERKRYIESLKHLN